MCADGMPQKDFGGIENPEREVPDSEIRHNGRKNLLWKFHFVEVVSFVRRIRE